MLNPPLQNQSTTSCFVESSIGGISSCRTIDMPSTTTTSEITSSFRVFVRSCENLTLPPPDAFLLDAEDVKESGRDTANASAGADRAAAGGVALFRSTSFTGRGRSDSDASPSKSSGGSGGSSGCGPVVYVKVDLRCGIVQLAPFAVTPVVPFSQHAAWGAWVVINARVCELPPGCMVHCEVVARWPEKGGGEVVLGAGRLALFAPYYMQQGNVEVAIGSAALPPSSCLHLRLQQFNFAVFHAGAVAGVSKICQTYDNITRFKEGRRRLACQQQQLDIEEQRQLSALGLFHRHSSLLHPSPPPSPHEWLHVLGLVDQALSFSPPPLQSPPVSASSSPAPFLNAEDRNYIWRYRRSILGVSHALPAVVQSTPWLTPNAVSELHSMLPQWSPMREGLLLLLLQNDVTDIVVRTWACLCLSSLPLARLPLLLPPIIASLRHEPVAGDDFIIISNMIPYFITINP
jgi:hypothetical protein